MMIMSKYDVQSNEPDEVRDNLTLQPNSDDNLSQFNQFNSYIQCNCTSTKSMQLTNCYNL